MFRRILCALLAVIMVVCLLPLNVIEASAASAMKASDKVVLYLKTMEGFTAIPRWDYVQWTVGYGNRCPEEHLERYLKEGIPIDEADALFLEQLVYFEDQVNAFIDRNKLKLTQNQFDAILSVSYNCGPAWLSGSSDLLDAVLKGTSGNAFVGLITQWCTAGGQYLPGLMRRRLTEADMYLNGRYNTQTPGNYGYVFFDGNGGSASAVAQGYDCNMYATPLVTATRSGYTFLGWYTAPTGGVKVTSLDENMNQMTLYAHWVKGSGGYDGPVDEMPEGVVVKVTGDVVNVRSGPGTDYPVINSVVYGQQVVITSVTTAGGRLWGKCEKGWLCLDYTTYKDVSGGHGGSDYDQEDDSANYQTPLYVTVVGKDITVYNGPDTGYPKVGTLKKDTDVLLVETYKMFTVWWGRLETGGWICLDRYVLLHNDQMLAHSVNVTVTNSYLNVRSGPGTNYGAVSSLSKGEVVEILAVESVDDTLWGRFYGGWIALQYTDFDAAKLEQYRNHKYGDWYLHKEATCVSIGKECRDCIYCGEHETRELGYGEHSYGDWYVSEPGNCTQPALERRDCIVCGNSELRDGEMNGHSMGDWYEHRAPTCVEDGLERRDCQHCDFNEVRPIAANGHAMSQWYVVEEPTYDQDGLERRECEHCDYYETRTLEATGHNFTAWQIDQEATCTTDGQEYRECTICGYRETRTIQAKGHSYSNWMVAVEATCTVDGREMRVCDHCQATESRVISATGHAFGEWETVTEPTCTKKGEQQRSCQHCDAKESQNLNALGHSMGAWYVETEPTCTERGKQCRDCQRCGYKEAKTIAAKGHSMGAWHTVTEATCQNTGLQQRECTACDHVESKTIAKTAHEYCDWYISIEPTYEKVGQERRDCENCGAYEVREKQFDGQVIKKIYATITVSSLNIRSGPGSNYSMVGYVTRGSVYEVFEQKTVSGKTWGRIEKGWICLTDYTKVEEKVEVIAHTHSFGEWYDLTAATCTTEGRQRRDCTGCTHYETRVVSAKGHSFGDWYTVREATPEQNGLERRDCAICGHYETQETQYQVEMVTRIYGTLTGNSYLNIRAGAGAGHALVGKLYYGERVEIFEIVKLGSDEWGRIDRGWVCITGYLTLEEVQEPAEHTHEMTEWETVLDATCTAEGEMRRGCKYCDLEETKAIPATGHSFGDWYTVREATATVKGLERRDCAHCDHYETKETDYKNDTVTRVFATVTVSFLNVRSGPGSNYGWVATVTYGTVHEVYEQKTVSGKVWGRIDLGWICLTGNTTVKTVEESVEHTHTMGQWYTVKEATCTSDGQLRRDCSGCDHSETQAVAAKGHSFGDWYTVREATAAQKGLERRDCPHCGHYETRETEYTGGTVVKVYATITAVSLTIRSGPGSSYSAVGYVARGQVYEVYEQKTVSGKGWGRIDKGWICLTGYTSLKEVEEVVGGNAVKPTMTVTASILNVRAGAGSGYKIVTSLAYGTKVTVLETKTVNGVTWARIEQGWVSMTYLA